MKKTLTITLEVKEIFFDIMNKTHLTGRSRNAADASAYELTSHMEVSQDEENSYQVRRSMTNAFSDLKTELAEYLDEEATTANNLIHEKVDADGQLVLALSMPSNYNLAAADALGNGMHQYLVNRSIADWFMITNKADATDYVKLAVEALDHGKRALYKRERPQRPEYKA
ncbi:MAG: hypothetical protein LIO90_05980 [Bacteroidales bacterium]|nr:hypothetical protein [Bacteroidales bacterium]